LKVELIFATPLEILMKTIRISHASEDRMDSRGDSPGQNDARLLKRIIEMRHMSTLESITYNFHIEDISRAVLQEISRHRIGYSHIVKSTRFTLGRYLSREIPQDPPLGEKEKLVGKLCVVPPQLGKEGKELFVNATYNALFEVTKLFSLGYPNDVVKYLLPESFKTELYATVNARELHHILKLRLSEKALWEFRAIAKAMYKEVKKRHPILWESFDLDKVK